MLTQIFPHHYAEALLAFKATLSLFSVIATYSNVTIAPFQLHFAV